MGFKVIVVGGGLAGLGLAHCFTKADIDFVVLERSDLLVPKGGASMALWPNNVRILDQLGLLEGAQAINCEIKYKHNVRKDGSVLQKNNMMERVGVALGHPWMCFHRPKLHEYLYESLPEHESRILSNQAVSSIDKTADGVTVTCQDGTVHEGSIVIGADGVNSAVRSHMFMTQIDPKFAEPFTTSYRALYGCSTWTSDLDPHTLYEMHGDKISIQIIPGPEMAMFVVYERLPTTVKGSKRYTDEEKQEFAKTLEDFHISEKVKFGDIWGTTEWSFFSGLEEGVAEKWYTDRAVLVGDTVHKMTPNVGLGLNSGWQSAAILTNGLRKLLGSNPDPSTEELNKVFQEYQEIRKKNASDMSGISGLYTRVVAWDNPLWKLADQYVNPYIGGDCALLDLLVVPLVAKQGNTLDFLDENNYKVGKTPWKKGRTTVPKEVKTVE
ncbi:2-heptyl-3-hydroxy-4(1H)-quinolone synthase [Cytospora mali]|uniref:2-heptyl-3-hydroxy-4(1H)-quinolone synthase n=1 Tax=Cytospora mali TaxID=578113 RepID=A0A194UX41_CYTMA|nr:2-heptyl-3-hydroxy-4(1H)-quinolone synthase [Valsa mali var. pyri (nom. inval.)]